MTTGQSVLLPGRSQPVLDEAPAGLRDLGYDADGTNDFSDVATRFDARATRTVRLTLTDPAAVKVTPLVANLVRAAGPH
jgi:hypothetical protein